MKLSALQTAAWLRGALLCLLSFGLSGCRDYEDCSLYNTCPGDLIILAQRLVGDGVDACTPCLNRSCKNEATRCSADVECNFASRCMMTTSPAEYQSCINTLHEQNFSQGREERHPWEGTNHEFGDCLHQRCKEPCSVGRFLCEETGNEYERLHVELAVRMFDRDQPFALAPHIWVRACDDHGCQTNCNGGECRDGWSRTDLSGRVGFSIPPYTTPETLYFELKPSDGHEDDFPLTLYYPGRLGNSDPQLLAIYLVSSTVIADGNAKLGRPPEVLRTLAQSLILPDSCIWEENSTPGLRVIVESEHVPQCHDSGCSGEACPPCVWYAVNKDPEVSATITDGTGAGIVGLREGKVTIHLEQGPGQIVSRRRIRMQAGAMTIARTFPLAQPQSRASATSR